MKKIMFLSIILLLNTFCTKKTVEKKIVPTPNVEIQNDKNDVLYGETIYPEQIKASIKHYNNKYNINIQYAENKNNFLQSLKKIKITNNPISFFQYNEGHKYGFIFVKYNNQDYCICVDTIPTLSEYTKDLKLENGNLYITFNDKKYRTIMFGENLQKSSKGCGSFTLVLLKHLLKNNAKMLFEIIDIEDKYSTEDKTKRDVNKKSCIRGINFEIIKKQDFAPEIYKYAQNIELQKEFDDKKIGKDVLFKEYRDVFSTMQKNRKNQDIKISTKLFDVTQKHKGFNLKTKHQHYIEKVQQEKDSEFLTVNNLLKTDPNYTNKNKTKSIDTIYNAGHLPSLHKADKMVAPFKIN